MPSYFGTQRRPSTQRQQMFADQQRFWSQPPQMAAPRPVGAMASPAASGFLGNAQIGYQSSDQGSVPVAGEADILRSYRDQQRIAGSGPFDQPGAMRRFGAVPTQPSAAPPQQVVGRNWQIGMNQNTPAVSAAEQRQIDRRNFLQRPGRYYGQRPTASQFTPQQPGQPARFGAIGGYAYNPQASGVASAAANKQSLPVVQDEQGNSNVDTSPQGFGTWMDNLDTRNGGNGVGIAIQMLQSGNAPWNREQAIQSIESLQHQYDSWLSTAGRQLNAESAAELSRKADQINRVRNALGLMPWQPRTSLLPQGPIEGAIAGGMIPGIGPIVGGAIGAANRQFGQPQTTQPPQQQRQLIVPEVPQQQQPPWYIPQPLQQFFGRRRNR